VHIANTIAEARQTVASGGEGVRIEIEADDVVYLEELYKPVQNLLSIGTS